MTTTVLSSKGQVIIPKPVRAAHHWNPGDRLVVEDTPDGVLLRPAALFKRTTLDDVAGCLKWSGPAKTLEEMEEAIAKGAQRAMDDCD
jgi:AbrB family looped-hinge helix DNA binding protein